MTTFSAWNEAAITSTRQMRWQPKCYRPSLPPTSVLGVTLDPHRPRAVPYTEIKDTSVRLMLTGKDRGNFDQKLHSARVSANRRNKVLEHLSITICAFESLLHDLDGQTITEKAETVVELLKERVAE